MFTGCWPSGCRKRDLFLIPIFFLTPLLSCQKETGPFFKPQTPVTQKLANGMEVFIVEDHELPTAQLFLYIRGGSVYDPPGKEGLSAVAMQSIRSGGGAGKSPDQIDQALEQVGASLEMGAGAEFYSASLSLLKKDLPQGLGILFGLLQNSGLDPGRFEIVKKKFLEGLERKKEDPLSLAYQEYPPFIYGDGTPWGRRPTPKSVDAITLQDVRDFHRRWIHPDRVLLAAAGDFTSEDLLKMINSLGREWNRTGEDLPEIPTLKENFQQRRGIISRDGLTQSTILMGHLGAKRENPDKYALMVMNFILGGSGSLTSRLGDEIRTSKGLAYGVWSDFGFGRDYGLFRAVAQTSLENTSSVVEKMESMIRQMATKPDFKEEEIRRAKNAILRSLFFDFETRFSQVKQLALFHLWGYPPDYLKTYQKSIARVSKKDLERVARKYLRPEGMQILLVTDPKKVNLKTLGAFENWRVE